jgi:hypothetical protein
VQIGCSSYALATSADSLRVLTVELMAKPVPKIPAPVSKTTASRASLS